MSWSVSWIIEEATSAEIDVGSRIDSLPIEVILAFVGDVPSKKLRLARLLSWQTLAAFRKIDSSVLQGDDVAMIVNPIDCTCYVYSVILAGNLELREV